MTTLISGILGGIAESNRKRAIESTVRLVEDYDRHAIDSLVNSFILGYGKFNSKAFGEYIKDMFDYLNNLGYSDSEKIEYIKFIVDNKEAIYTKTISHPIVNQKFKNKLGGICIDLLKSKKVTAEGLTKLGTAINTAYVDKEDRMAAFEKDIYLLVGFDNTYTMLDFVAAHREDIAHAVENTDYEQFELDFQELGKSLFPGVPIGDITEEEDEIYKNPPEDMNEDLSKSRIFDLDSDNGDEPIEVTPEPKPVHFPNFFGKSKSKTEKTDTVKTEIKDDIYAPKDGNTKKK